MHYALELTDISVNELKIGTGFSGSYRYPIQISRYFHIPKICRRLSLCFSRFWQCHGSFRAREGMQGISMSIGRLSELKLLNLDFHPLRRLNRFNDEL